MAREYEEKYQRLIEERSKDLELIHKAYQNIKNQMSDLDKEIKDIKGKVTIKKK
jgi:hypothetical protein